MSNDSITQAFKVYAGYRQFYVQDIDPSGDTAARTFWSRAAMHRSLALSSGIIGVGTASYDYVSGTLQLLKSKPDENFVDAVQWEHIVEASLHIKNGSLDIASCPDNEIAARISVKPAFYRIRVYSKNLEFDGGKDEYLILVWAEPLSAVKVLKQGCIR
jgi:hypothetical protein